MKLRSLALNQFKKFTSHTRLEGIEDRLNIVVGPNEMGKSTLLDALRAVLFEKHDSKAKPIRELQNERSQAAPVVELRFELENGIHTISKRFMKNPYARLRCPDGTVFEGDAAEDRLRDLLNFSEPGKKGGSPETLGMWNVLWVKQGQSFSALDIPKSARANLHGALESEVGTVLGGRRGRDLPQTIEKQLGELITSTGRSRGKYKTAIEQVADIENELEELREKKRDLSDTLKDLEEDQQKLERLSDAGRDEADKAELEMARKRRDELTELEGQVKTAESELEVLKLRLQQAKQKEKERRAQKDDIATEENALDKLSEERKGVIEQEKQNQAYLEKLRNEKEKAETAAKEADEALLMKSRVLTAVEIRNRISELKVKHEKASDAEERRLEARKRVAAISVTEEMMKRITDAEKEKEKAANRLNTTSTLIAFDMEDPSGVQVDGSPLVSGKDSLQAISPTMITIPEKGSILIEPAVSNRDELLVHREKTETRLKEILDEAGVLTVKDAETLYNNRQQALGEEDFARREAELYAPPTDEYEAGAHALEGYIRKLEQTLKNETDKFGSQNLPERREAEAVLEEAQDESEIARHALNKARAALEGPEDVLKDIAKERASSEARYEEGGKRLAKLRDQLEKSENEYPEDKLREETQAAEEALKSQEALVAQLREQRSGKDTLKQIEARVKRLEKTAEDKRNKRQRLEINIERLKERVNGLEGVGLDENIGRKSRELELREQERRRYEREAQVLNLLLDTLHNAEREAKELYLSPVTDRMRPYLQLLFPGSDITIDEDLHITGVIREAGYEEPFPLLSMGTQEQIAVLVRLAFAEMLVEQERPATVVLDDALVFSDDARMNRMFDILNIASSKVQVLIFTCREQLFEEAGGHVLSLKPGGPEELISA